MFFGSFSHTLDKKGRIILPAKFREIIKEKYMDTFMMTRWMDDCISLFPTKEWRSLEQQLNALPDTDTNSRLFTRFIYSNTADAVIDKQGRIFIPANLRTAVGIDKDVLIVGHSNRIEIWSKSKWDSYNSKFVNRPVEEIAQELSKLKLGV